MSDTELQAQEVEKHVAQAAKGVKAFFMKDGEFSKTASFATLANMLVLVAYVLSWFAGSEITFFTGQQLMIPAFDEGAALSLLGILNGTYLGNNVIKYKKDSSHR